MPKAPRADTRAEDAPAPERFADTPEYFSVETSAPEGPQATALSDAPAAPASPAAPATEATPARTHFTPDELAVLTGNVAEAKGPIAFGEGARPKKQPAYSWQHAAAAQLHGWNAHEHHAGSPIQLSRADYEAALAAASAPVATLMPNGLTRTVYEPHKPALSPHAPKEG